MTVGGICATRYKMSRRLRTLALTDPRGNRLVRRSQRLGSIIGWSTQGQEMGLPPGL